MDTQAFWNLLDGLDPEDAATELAARLEELDPADIAEFQRHFDEAHERAYTWPLWGAAYLIEGGCSDDGFTDFRYGLISRGKMVYEADRVPAHHALLLRAPVDHRRHPALLTPGRPARAAPFLAPSWRAHYAVRIRLADRGSPRNGPVVKL